MKKIASAVMAFILLLTLSVRVGAASPSFPDITDADLARDVAVLQMLGVVSGDENGNFMPDGTLTRAAFCKMAVIAMGRGDEAYAYASRTIFPDVRAGYWARGYINLAVSGANKIIMGGGDGLFRPDDPITTAQAVTILMRILGYTDSDVGMLWPEGYIALAMEKGLTKGISLSSPGEPLTRAAAARLFCRLLGTNKKGGGAYIESLGTTTANVIVMQLDVTAPDGTKGAVKTSAGTFKTLTGNMPDCLMGLRGTLVKNSAGLLLTFIPDSRPVSVITVSSAGAASIRDTNGLTHSILSTCTVYMPEGTEAYSAVFFNILPGTQIMLFYGDDGSVESMFINSAAAVSALIVGMENSVNPLLPLTGNDTTYKIYKNGVQVSLSDIAPYDVATYDKYSKVVHVFVN